MEPQLAQIGLSFAKTLRLIIDSSDSSRQSRFFMLNAFVIVVPFVILVFSGHQQVALENAAFRQQLAVFKRDMKRPQLRARDRLFWIVPRIIWKEWKSALMIVRPETVISWQRNFSLGGLAGLLLSGVLSTCCHPHDKQHS